MHIRAAGRGGSLDGAILFGGWGLRVAVRVHAVPRESAFRVNERLRVRIFHDWGELFYNP
jgi:hypothetical protein